MIKKNFETLIGRQKEVGSSKKRWIREALEDIRKLEIQNFKKPRISHHVAGNGTKELDDLLNLSGASAFAIVVKIPEQFRATLFLS